MRNRPRLLLACLAAMVVAFSGCSHLPSTPSMVKGTWSAEERPEPVLPPSIPFADAPADLAHLRSLDFDVEQLVAAGWVATRYEGLSEVTAHGCSLMLVVSHYPTSADAREIDSTASYLAEYMGTTAWEEVLSAHWNVNGDASRLDALTVSGISIDGEFEVATARVLSSVGKAYLSSLVCETREATADAFAYEITPNLAVTMR